MGRLTTLARLGGALALGLLPALAGCNGAEEDPEQGKLSAETKQEVDTVLHSINNRSESERWRGRLIELGQGSPQAKAHVLQASRTKLEQSRDRGGVGPGVLRTPGRRRVMEVVTALRPDPLGEELLRFGLEDIDVEVKLAAAAGLADWGDVRAIPALLEVALDPDAGEELRRKAVQGLRRLAEPDHRPTFLSALREDGRDVLEPIALGTFPEGSAGAPALREVAAKHPNPWAQAFALRVLGERGDEEARDLAERALESGHEAVRPTALEVLGAAGGAQAAGQLEETLRSDPADPVPAVDGLYNTGTFEAVERAAEVARDRSVATATRAAVCLRFFRRMSLSDAPEVYRERDARALALDVLREIAETEDAPRLVAAAASGLGALGRPGVDVEILLGLLQSPSREVGEEVVHALGLLGGEFAAVRLVELLHGDPALRQAAAEALTNFADPGDIPVDAVIDALDHSDAAARAAALRALEGLSGVDDGFGYDPEAPASERRAAMERWREWWGARRGGGGGW